MKKYLLILLTGIILLNANKADAQFLPCANIIAEALPTDPQSGPHNYFGIRVTLDQTYSENITVNGYIFDEGSPNTSHPFTLIVTASNLTNETALNYYETGATETGVVVISSVTPLNITHGGTIYNTICLYKTCPLTIIGVESQTISGILSNAFDTVQINWDSLKSNLGITETIGSSDFDFDNVFLNYETDSSNLYSYSVPHTSNSNSNSVNIAFAMHKIDGSYLRPTITVSNTYLGWIKIADLTNGTIMTMTNYRTAGPTIGELPGTFGGTEFGCGQCVSNCIADAYVSHGWASVWAFIQSVFIPSTAVAIAGACVAKCCVRK